LEHRILRITKRENNAREEVIRLSWEFLLSRMTHSQVSVSTKQIIALKMAHADISRRTSIDPNSAPLVIQMVRASEENNSRFDLEKILADCEDKAPAISG